MHFRSGHFTRSLSDRASGIKNYRRALKGCIVISYDLGTSIDDSLLAFDASKHQSKVASNGISSKIIHRIAPNFIGTNLV